MQTILTTIAIQRRSGQVITYIIQLSVEMEVMADLTVVADRCLESTSHELLQEAEMHSVSAVGTPPDVVATVIHRHVQVLMAQVKDDLRVASLVLGLLFKVSRVPDLNNSLAASRVSLQDLNDGADLIEPDRRR